MRSLVLLAAVVTTSLACRTPDPEPDTAALGANADEALLAALAGRWWLPGPHDILGGHGDRILAIHRGPDGWTIELSEATYPRIGRDEPVALVRGTPTPLRSANGRLGFLYAPHADATLVEVQLSACLRDGRLVAPVWNTVDGRAWDYASWQHGCVLRFEHDPRNVLAGRAEWSESRWGAATFRYETSMQPRFSYSGESVLTTRVFELAPPSSERECCALVFDPEWGTYARLANGDPTYVEQPWLRMDEAEWAKLVAGG